MTDDEIIEGEAVEVAPDRALVAPPAGPPQLAVMQGGVVALAAMSDDEFARGIEALRRTRTRVDQVKAAIMREDVDYGTIPGTPKPTLLKPGAETLLRTFGLADSYVIARTNGDGEVEPHITYEVRARIHLGDTSGPVIGEGVGEANSWEKKHRYRGFAGRTCPDCGKETIIKSRPPRTGWWCGTRDGGCGHAFADDDARITSQSVEQQENPDPYDLANTLLKMAKKRALVDGVLTATGTSGVFTQDEDAPGHQRPAHQPVSGQGASSAPAVGSGSTSAPAAAPGASTAPADGLIHAKVDTAPDGPRQIRGKGLKLEVKVKIGGRNHRVTLWGDAAEAVDRVRLAAGEEIAVDADQREEIWQEGKPPIRHLENVRTLRVLREGAWADVWGDPGGAQPTLQLGEDAPPAASPPADLPPPAPKPAPAAPEERWAKLPDETALNERVALVEWGMPEDPRRPGGRFFRAVFRREDGSLLQATAPTDELVALTYLAIDAAGAVEFRWSEGELLQLVGTYRATGPKGWVLIVGLG